MLAGHFLEPHKKGYKAIENRKKGLIVQRQSITFATLLALYRRVHRQAPPKCVQKTNSMMYQRKVQINPLIDSPASANLADALLVLFSGLRGRGGFLGGLCGDHVVM